MPAHRIILATVATVTAITLALSTAAHATPWGQVTCDHEPRPPECQVTVIDPGDDGPVNAGDGGGEPVCRIDGKIVPCHEPGLGWLHTDGCYHSPDPKVGPGQHWARACYNPISDDFHHGGWVQRDTPPASVVPVVQRAVDRLTIPQPAIAANPDLDTPQVVRVPVWWWVDTGTWSTRTATASIPALTITAQATPTQIIWHAGDGTTTTCAGPGTRWAAGRDPAAASPTCGHTYTTTSRTSPGGTYTLRAALTWQVTWSGGNMSGTLPPLTTSTTAPITVTELRSIVTS